MDEVGTGNIPGNTHLYAGQEVSAVGVCMRPPPYEGECPENASLVSITGAGHMPQMERAAEVNAAILRNIRRAL